MKSLSFSTKIESSLNKKGWNEGLDKVAYNDDDG